MLFKWNHDLFIIGFAHWFRNSLAKVMWAVGEWSFALTRSFDVQIAPPLLSDYEWMHLGALHPQTPLICTLGYTVDVLWTTLEWCRDILSRSFLREKIVSWQGAINDRITLSVKFNTFGYQTTRYSIERILTLHQSKFQFFSISGCLLYCWQSLQF